MIGEQPGDQEDVKGEPFVGPAGRLLDEGLVAAGIDRKEVYVTNAVKHFKWVPQGKRRLHQKPNAREIAACRPWLGAEILLGQPQIVVALGGTIRVVEGQYKAFGQDVTITRGLLVYQNTPLSDPQIDLVAERKIKDTDITVAVNVRGSIDNPFIAITSTPSMSSNEALSYLLTGRSIDTLQSGEAANVNQAAESLAVSGGGLLLGGIGTRLGLDEVSVERTGDDDTSVVLGKALSPKLFVSYGISIAEAINTIKLRYTLNERWSIKAESGLEQSADFEYRIER